MKFNRHDSPEYKSWSAMIRRCTNPEHDKFPYYGGRGIVVCERWLDFDNFVKDMGIRPPGTQLERMNNDENYGPKNCRWATRSENMRNTSRNIKYEAFGETKCLIDWYEDERCIVKYDTLKRRIYRGYSVESAMTLPLQKPGPKSK